MPVFFSCFQSVLSAYIALTALTGGNYNTAKAMIKASSRIMAVYREPRVCCKRGGRRSVKFPLYASR